MKTLLLGLAAMTLLVAGCAAAGDTPDEPVHSDVELDSAHPSHDTASTNWSCTYASGQTWCNDLMTGRWCTNSTSYANGWDYTGCNWKGWRNININGDGYDVYCHPDYPGYQWGPLHRHCPG